MSAHIGFTLTLIAFALILWSLVRSARRAQENLKQPAFNKRRTAARENVFYLPFGINAVRTAVEKCTDSKAKEEANRHLQEAIACNAQLKGFNINTCEVDALAQAEALIDKAQTALHNARQALGECPEADEDDK